MVHEVSTALPDSWWFAYTALAGNLGGVAANVPWSQPAASAGSDIALNTDPTKINILTTGDYVLALDVQVETSNDAKGVVQAALNIPDDPWLNVGNGSWAMPVDGSIYTYLSDTWVTQPIRLPAGRQINYEVWFDASAGTVDVGSMALTIKRIN